MVHQAAHGLVDSKDGGRQLNNDVRTWDERFWEPDEILWNILFKHRNHEIEIATYGDKDNPDSICLECMTCNQVILDAETYTICAREDLDQ